MGDTWKLIKNPALSLFVREDKYHTWEKMPDNRQSSQIQNQTLTAMSLQDSPWGMISRDGEYEDF